MSATTKPSRREQRAQAQHFIDTLEGTAFPNSKRIYITGSQADIRIPMREIQLSPTLIGGTKDNPQFEDNEAVPVYDTSGPYGDPDVTINVQQGLAKLRQPWITARNDSEELDDRSSAYTKERLADDGLDELRFSGLLTPNAPKPASALHSCTMPVRGWLPRRWNLSPSVKTWAASAFALMSCASSILAKALARACRKISPLNLYAMKWPPGAPLFPPILTIRNPSR
mgnify:CR=1 FL=1